MKTILKRLDWIEAGLSDWRQSPLPRGYATHDEILEKIVEAMLADFPPRYTPSKTELSEQFEKLILKH